MADLQGKYQKLAAEYSKLRAQVPVLKKAVLDEQGKLEEYKETIKERDQSVRKYQQEIDSLTFRNKQLTSRVEVLQQELDGTPTPGKSKKSKNPVIAPGPNADGSQAVIGEELQSKIEENARLHKQVYETDQEYRQQLMTLQDQLAIYEREASQHQHVLAATMATNKTQIEKLTEDKVMLEIRLEKAEKEGRTLKIRAEQAEEQLKNLQADLSSQLNEANQIISDKIPFNDTRLRLLNTLNVPTHDRRHQLLAKDLMGQAAAHVKELIQGLSNWHTYCEQRTHIYPVDAETDQLSEVNKKLCQYLHENAAYLRPVDQAFKAFNEGMKEDSLTTLETAVGLQEFACQLRRYAAYASKLLPYHLLSIEEECAVSSCTQTLEAKNLQVHAALKHFNSSFLNVENYVSILAHQSQPNCDHPRSSHTKLFQLLAKSLSDLHEATKELSKQFNAKVSLEHQLPTATVKLKTTDECIVTCLVSLVTCTSKISAFFEGNLDFFSKASGYKTRGSSISQSDTVDGPRAHPCVSECRQHAANYLSSITGSVTESVPYQVAVQNRKTLLSSTESRDSLAQQVVNFHDKISRLEQEKEHWMLESQLMQMKYEKELQKNTTLSKQVKGEVISADGVNLSTPAISARSGRANTFSNIPLDVSMLGTVHSVVHPDEDIDPREQLIKNHYNTRIKKLTAQFQTADSKAVNFSAECRALHKRLTLNQRQNFSLQEQVTSSTQSVTQLKDELQTTTRSYEGQLSMMSEHLAGMNEKLTTQKDEIEVLKYQLQNTKSGKKGKVK